VNVGVVFRGYLVRKVRKTGKIFRKSTCFLAGWCFGHFRQDSRDLYPQAKEQYQQWGVEEIAVVGSSALVHGGILS